MVMKKAIMAGMCAPAGSQPIIKVPKRIKFPSGVSMKRPFHVLSNFVHGVFHIPASRKVCLHAEKELRNHLSERQIDRMVEASFPASDPPSTY